MIDLGALFILRPFWLLCLPLTAFLAVLAFQRGDGLAQWRRIVDADLMPVLRRLGHVTDGRPDPRPWWLGAAAAVLALGLSGPATRNADTPAFRNLDAVMILIDLSPSVTEGGGLPAAQAAVSRLIDRHGTRPVALAVFSGETFLVSVPTENPESLQTAVAVLNTDLMPVSGSRPDRALAMAHDTLRDAVAERPDIVLVSDGGAIGPGAFDLVRQMASEDMRLSAVFVPPGSAPYGMPPPDRAALARLVSTGGGIIVDAKDTSALETLLLQRHRSGSVPAARRALLFVDHGRLAVVLSLLLMLPLFRRRQVS